MKQMFFLVIMLTFMVNIQAQTTYNDVAGIFWNKCATCHNPNGNGQFDLINYSETVTRMSAIQNAITTKKMPPWQMGLSFG